MPVKETFCTVKDGDKQTDLDSSRVHDVALDDDSGLFPVPDKYDKSGGCVPAPLSLGIELDLFGEEQTSGESFNLSSGDQWCDQTN